ncbi:MAG: metallophosphoesterase [Azoarcus sp.]|nr:metallophosphoesterase [Azoarcus sp.]
MLIAQITDLHVSFDPAFLDGRVAPLEAVLRAVAVLAALDPRPDAVLLTGDLAENGSAEEYAFIRHALGELDLPVFAVPGNHDSSPAMRTGLGSFMRASEASHACYVVDDFPLSLVGLDTSVAGKAHGALDPARLEWLEKVLGQRAGRPVFMFMHHPPFDTGIRTMDACGLLEGRERLAELIAWHGGVVGVVCGHVHRSIHTSVAGVPTVVAPSCAHQIALELRANAPLQYRLEPPAIALHRCEQGQMMVSHVRYIPDFPGPWRF